MSVQCGWCNKTMGEKGKGEGITTTICPNCRRAYFPETVKAEPQKAKMGATDCLRAIG